MILFKKLRFSNFLSTGNQFTEINFQKSNTNLIMHICGVSVWEFEFIKFENEQQWGRIVIVFEDELEQGVDIKNQFF